MAKKYYAIKEPAKYNGIYYEEWNNIKHLVQGNGFSIFKSFETKEEAENFIGVEVEDEEDENSVDIYVDGSFNQLLNLAGSGILFFDNETGEIIQTYSFSTLDTYGERNITGEIQATLKAILEGIYQGYTKLNIYYDYSNIEAWAMGYKAKSVIGQNYIERLKWIKEKFPKIKISFHKVVAHSGNYLNDYVDDLAKQGCGISR